MAAFGNDTESPNRWRRTFAHEIAHTYGLNHTTETTNGRHWFDVYDRVIKPPNPGGELLDVMVPDKTEPEAWISPETYSNLMLGLCDVTGQASMLSQAAPTENLAATENLMVSGTITKGPPPTGSLNPLFRTSTAPPRIPPPPRAGPGYCINLKNDATLLSQTCFDVGFDGDGRPASAMPFGMVLPIPTGLNSVELTRGTTTVLSSRVASPNLPTVTVTFPNAPDLTVGGEQTITWTGSHPDRAPLTYNLLYSRDNGTSWMGVAPGLTTTSYTLDFDRLPGGTSSLMKVQASDGWNSAEGVSNFSFKVANKPPTAVITSPRSGASFNANTFVTLQGSGLDLEDGSLADGALSWASDKDGALGTGRFLQVNLSPGTHTLTLSARDSDGLTSTATITCTILSAPPPGPPPAPILTATPGNAQGTLSWTASAGATSYNVKRATVSGGPYTMIATGVTATTFTDTGLANGTTFFYVVSAVNANGESVNSNQAQATPTAGAPPPAPTGLTATGGATSISLTWTAAAGATSYNVKRATVSGGPYTTIATGVTATSFTDDTVTLFTFYFYVVSAVNANGESPNSNEASDIAG